MNDDINVIFICEFYVILIIMPDNDNLKSKLDLHQFVLVGILISNNCIR